MAITWPATATCDTYGCEAKVEVTCSLKEERVDFDTPDGWRLVTIFDDDSQRDPDAPRPPDYHELHCPYHA